MLHDSLGYGHYQEIASGVADNVMLRLITLLKNNSWMVAGGAAMVLHFGKEARQISPDLDIMLLPQEADKLIGAFGKQTPGLFGHSVVVQGLTVDFLLATREWKRQLIKNASSIGAVPVVSVPGLIALKFEAQRDKDVADLQIIYRRQPTAFDEARILVKRAMPNDVEDFDSIIMLLKHLVKSKL